MAFGLGSDRATFSSAGSEVAQTAGDAAVRMEKVASIQAALADGARKTALRWPRPSASRRSPARWRTSSAA